MLRAVAPEAENQVRFECLVQHHIASVHSKAAKVARFLHSNPRERAPRTHVCERGGLTQRYGLFATCASVASRFNSVCQNPTVVKNTPIARHVCQPEM